MTPWLRLLLAALPQAERARAVQQLLADQYALCIIEELPAEHAPDGTRVWRDLRALTDANEQPPELVDLHAIAIAHADHRRLITRHPSQPHLARPRKLP